MKPRNIMLETLRHKNTGKVPWIPFAGVHAGTLAGYDATEVLTDGDKLFESLMEVNRLYRPCGQPVVFDLQLEAEVLGCELVWAKDSPPSVSSHPLEDSPSVPCRCTLPTAEDGRLPMVLDVMHRLKAAVGDTTALYGLICGPFTLCSHLRGNDIFMDMFDDRDFVHQLLDYCADVAIRMTELFADAGMDVIAVVDPLVSQVSAAHFEEFLSKPFIKIFDYIRKSGRLSSFFVCGDATRNIEVMCKTGPDSIFVDENVDIVNAKSITDRYDIALGGNIPLTTVMLHGTQQDNMKYVVDMLHSLPNTHNFIVAPGCDMPFAVPVENTIAVAQAVWQTEEVRKILENYVAIQEDIDVELPDYDRLKKPLIEVFTLDSATCAACTYMMGAVNAAKQRYGDSVDVVEYKYTLKENIARCKKMGVKHLPSLYINGQLKFSSLIPRSEQLDAEIEQAIASNRMPNHK